MADRDEGFVVDLGDPETPDWAREAAKRLREILDETRRRGFSAVADAYEDGAELTVVVLGAIRCGPGNRVVLSDCFVEGDGSDAMTTVEVGRAKIQAHLEERREKLGTH